MKVHKEIGSKERLLEMFQKVNKVKVVEHKEEKPVIKEGYTELGHKVKNSRIITEDIDVADPANFQAKDVKLMKKRPAKFVNKDVGSDHIIDIENDDDNYDFNPDDEQFGESFDNPKKKDHKYLNKSYDNVQDGKPDDGVRYPVEKPLKVKDPSLEKMKGDDAPIVEDNMEGYEDIKRKMSLEDGISLANYVYNMEGDENAFLEKYIGDKQLTIDSLKSQIDTFLRSNRVVPDTNDYYALENLVTVLNDIYDASHVRGSVNDPNRALNINPVLGGGQKGFGEAEDIEVEPEVEDSEFSPDAEFVDDTPPVDADPAIDDIPEPGSGDEEEVEGGLADGAEPSEFDNAQILKGMEVEMEHTDDPKVALEIAMDHLTEIPDYYDHLEDMEAQATGAEEASPEDAVDAMGDGQEGEAEEEITGDEEPTEKDVLWGRMDSIGDEPDEIDNYEPKGL